MARYAGNQGYVVLNGVRYDTKQWEVEVNGENVETRAGGDQFVSRTPTFIDWSAKVTAYLPAGSVPNPLALINTNVPFAGHLLTGGTGLFVATGLVTDAKVNVPVENEAATYEVSLKSSDPNTGPVITTGSP